MDIESPDISIHSSIIKPRFRQTDTLFSTMNMYEDDSLFQNVNSVVRLAMPGSNIRLFSKSNYFQGLWYTFLRYILNFYFLMYQYYLLFTSQINSIFLNLQAFFWFFLSFLPFPEDSSIIGPASLKSSTPSYRSIDDGSYMSRFYNIIKGINLLPTQIGNLILQRSLLTNVPRNRLQIRHVTGRFYIPDHMAIIFEMSPLVLPQPPEIPVPFLNYEKKIVVPEKDEVAKNLAIRAEWFSMHHTHKAAETFRVLYEAAKCISWCACSGIRILTIYESNGYSWSDMHKISTIIIEEMKNLTLENYHVYDFIKLVNLETGEVLNVFDNTDRDMSNDKMMSDIEPKPETGTILNSVDSPIFETEIINTFHTNLTVFFMSNKQTNEDVFRVLKIKQDLSKKLNRPEIFSNTNGAELMHYPIYPGYVENYTDPEVLLKFCSLRQTPNSLTGYPLLTDCLNDAAAPVFSTFTEPANFYAFTNSIATLNSVLKCKKP